MTGPRLLSTMDEFAWLVETWADFVHVLKKLILEDSIVHNIAQRSTLVLWVLRYNSGMLEKLYRETLI